jgi:hypothetical protein
MEKLKQMVKFVKGLGDGCEFLDDAVYTMNRQMKCIFQSKPGATVAKPLYPKDYDLRDFFIGSFHGDETPSYFSSVAIPPATLSAIRVNCNVEKVNKTLTLPDVITSNIDMLNPHKLLAITPSEADMSHGHRWRVAMFCYHNGITEAEYMDWLYRSAPSKERIEKVKQFWSSKAITDDKFAPTINGYIKYLSNWYPELTEGSHNTGYFLNSFDLKVPSTLINRIEQDHFNTHHKAVIFNIGMGGGKTTTTLEYLNVNAKKSFIWLAPRQTLVLNTSHRMNNEFNISHTSHLKVGKDKKKLTEAKRLLICNQSLHYLTDDQHFDVVVIDEIETVLLSWLETETHGANMGDNFRRFCHLLRHASKIILLDAFTTTKTINLLNLLGIKNERIMCFESRYKPAEKLLNVNEDFKVVLKKIVDAYFNGEKSYIFYPYKKGTEKSHYGIVEMDTKIKKLIKERRLSEAKTDAEKLAIHEDETSVKSILYYAESEAKNQLGNINESWAEANYILTTSSITVGVNYEGLDYDNVFLIGSGSTNNPRDIIQSSMRIRKPKKTTFEVFFFDIKTKEVKQYPAYFHDNDAIYQSLVIHNLREIQANFSDAFMKFCSLTNYTLGVKLDELMRKRKRAKFINDMYECSQLIEYTKVDVVDEFDLPDLESKVYGRSASVMDRLTVERFYFDKTFRNLEPSDRAYIWNTNSRQFFKGIKDQLIGRVMADNGVNDIIKVDFNKLNVSAETMDYIKTSYSIVVAKKPVALVIRVLNDVLGFMAVSSKKDKRNKHIGWEKSNRFGLCAELHKKKVEADDAFHQARLMEFLTEEESAKSYLHDITQHYKHLTDADFEWVTSDFGDEILVCKVPYIPSK